MIDRSFYVQLGGRDFVLFAGLLDAATNAGLTSVITTPLQFPSEENGHMAVVKARIEFADGRAFEALGDASPQSVGRMILPHLIRMAETRSVGRAFRWALNIGATMKEELGGDEDAPDSNGKGAKPAQRARHDPPDHAEQQPNQPVCSEEGCSETLSPSLVALCQRRGATLEGRFLCAVHLEEYARAYKARQAEAGSA